MQAFATIANLNRFASNLTIGWQCVAIWEECRRVVSSLREGEGSRDGCSPLHIFQGTPP
jgi:hypothetical protein